MNKLNEAINKSLAGRLGRLLAEPTIARRIGKNKIKISDPEQRQKHSAVSTNPYTDRFRRLHISDRMYNSYNAGEVRLAKLNFYQDYEAMDQDPIISSALDIYSDESTTRNHKGELLSIECDDENVKAILNNLFYDIMNIEHNIWSWIRNTCKYGDFYLYMDLEDKVGIKNVIPFTPYVVKRQEGYDPDNPYAYRFLEDGTYNTSYNNVARTSDGVYESYEMAHFRLLADTNYLPYGKSMIEPARKIYKQLSLMEDAMMLVRIMRAPERRIFKIDVGNLPPEEIDGYIEEIKNKMQKTPYIDRATGEYNLKYNIMNMLEDYYLPVRGSQSGTEIDTLQGLNSTGQIEDVEYLRLKEMSALKIPSAFLGYDEGVEGKSTLAAEDIRFARTIERVQTTFVSELKKMATIHLFIQGYKGKELVSFKLKLNNPSIVYQRQQVDMLSEQMTVATDMIESKLFSTRYIYENIFKLSEDDYNKMKEEIVEDQKNAFRLNQIAEEGNDPNKTGQSFGTPHDIAALNMSGDGEDAPHDPDGKQDDDERGQPEKQGSFGTHKDANGQDPDGRKTIAKAMTGNGKDRGFKGKGALDNESVVRDAMLKSLYMNVMNKRHALTETMKKNKKTIDDISFLDENNLKSL